MQLAEALHRAGPASVQVLTARMAPRPGHREAHLHSVPTLVVCLAGMVRITSVHGDIDLTAGHCLAIAPGAWHHHTPVRPGSVGFGQGLMEPCSDAEFYDDDQLSLLRLPLEPSRTLLRRLVAEPDPALRCAAAARLLGELFGQTAVPGTMAPALRRMTAFIWGNLHRPATAADVLAASGISPRQAYRVFKDHFGQTPKQVLLHAHLQLAEEFLKEGYTVGAAATASGFNGRADLTRAWRRAHGAPPTQRMPTGG